MELKKKSAKLLVFELGRVYLSKREGITMQ